MFGQKISKRYTTQHKMCLITELRMCTLAAQGKWTSELENK